MQRHRKVLQRLGDDKEEGSAKAVEIKLRNLDSEYKASNRVQMILTHSEETHPQAHIE